MKDGQRKRAGWLGSQLALYFFKDCRVMYKMALARCPRKRSQVNKHISLSPAVFIMLFVYVLFGLTMVSCGLQNVPFYDAPDFSSYGSNAFVLRHSGNISESTGSSVFRGYEIFYHIYSDEPDAISDQGILLGLANNMVGQGGTGDPDSFVSYATSLGFARIRLKPLSITDSDSLPLIKPIEADCDYYLTLPTDSDWYINSSIDPTPIYVSRSLLSARSVDKLSFFRRASYQDGDADYNYNTSNPPSGSSLYFVLFAVGYGINTEDLSENYGAPKVIPVVTYLPGA